MEDRNWDVMWIFYAAESHCSLLFLLQHGFFIKFIESKKVIL